MLGSGDIGLIMARRLTLEGATVLRVAEILPYAAGLSRNVVQCLHDYGIPLQLRSTVTRIYGSPRLEAVDVTELDTGRCERIECDLLLLAVGLICENELARSAGVELDPLTGGPCVDDCLSTSRPGIFAAGNSLHVSDLADWVSLEGLGAGEQAAACALGEAPQSATAQVSPGEGVRYVVPQKVNLAGNTERVTLSFRVQQPLKDVRIDLWGGDRPLTSHRQRVCVPGEMVKWEVERRVFADQPQGVRVTARGEAFCT